MLEFYMLFGLVWAGFCLGCQVCKNSGSAFWKLGVAAVLNFTMWPISVCLALCDHGKS